MRIHFHRDLYIVGLLSLVLSYSLLAFGMLTSQSQRTGSDFIAFYAAGRVARLEGMTRVYDSSLQQTVEQEQVGFQLAPGQVLLYNHVPFLIPLLWLISGSSYLASFMVWVSLLLLIYGIGIWILTRGLRVGHPYDWLCAAAALTFYPLFVSLMNGQDTAFVFLGLGLYLTGLLDSDDCLAGLGLSVTILRPQLAVMLAVPFLFRRRKVLAWFCAGSLALGLIGLAAVGVQGMRGFMDQLLVSAGGEWYGMKEASMVNLVGLLWRFAPGLGSARIHAIGWICFGLALAGLCLLWVRSQEIRERQVVIALVIACFVSPHLHYHDLTLLLVALLAGIGALVRQGYLMPRHVAVGPLASSWLLLLGSMVPALKYNLPYLVMACMVLAAWFPSRFLRRREVENLS